MTRIAALSRTDIHTTHDLSVGGGVGREIEPLDCTVSAGRGSYTGTWR